MREGNKTGERVRAQGKRESVEKVQNDKRKKNHCHTLKNCFFAGWRRAPGFKLLAGCGWLSSKPVFYWFPWAVLRSELCAASPSFMGPGRLGAQRADGTHSQSVGL